MQSSPCVVMTGHRRNSIHAGQPSVRSCANSRLECQRHEDGRRASQRCPSSRGTCGCCLHLRRANVAVSENLRLCLKLVHQHDCADSSHRCACAQSSLPRTEREPGRPLRDSELRPAFLDPADEPASRRCAAAVLVAGTSAVGQVVKFGVLAGADGFQRSVVRDILTPREVRDVEKMCGLSYYVRMEWPCAFAASVPRALPPPH